MAYWPLMIRFHCLILATFVSSMLGVMDSSAQAKLHPAHTVAEGYLKAIQTHSWKEAAAAVETASLDNLKRFQKEYLNRAPTMEDEEALLALLGLKSISDIDALAPTEIFIRRGQAKTKQLKDAKTHISEMKESVKVKTLGTVVDGKNMVHVMIRKEFIAASRAFSELAFVSLVQEGKSWKVSLDAQEPKVTPAAEMSPIPEAQGTLHPANEVAIKYLNAVNLHNWADASLLVDTVSLESLKRFQKEYLENAPTLNEEMELLRLLGMSEISDIEAMTPRAVFIARGQAKTKRLVDADKHVAELKKTLKIKCLGTATEGDSSVHVAVRKQFVAHDRGFDELSFVTLVKEGAVWKVSLDAQEPKIFGLKEGQP